MNVLLLKLVAVVLFVSAKLVDSTLLYGDEWKQWKEKHSVLYTSDNEEMLRYSIWVDNMKYIEKHNNRNLSYTLKMNQFGDLTLEEYSTIYTCHIVVDDNESDNKEKKYEPPEDVDLPTKIDWRKKKAVTSMKNQGEYRCHSCYAFAAVGALESHHAIKTGSRVRLSEQNVIDCSRSYGNTGCNGGNYRKSFQYIIENGGIDTQNYYPYKALENTCKYSNEKIGATMSSVLHIESGSESSLKSAVGLKGPVLVSIDHRHKSFQFYGGGIYSEPDCYSNSNLLTHEMLVVGYSSSQYYNYWIIKNSYGVSWGNWGYMLMVRGQNACGIATDAAFPVI